MPEEGGQYKRKHRWKSPDDIHHLSPKVKQCSIPASLRSFQLNESINPLLSLYKIINQFRPTVYHLELRVLTLMISVSVVSALISFLCFRCISQTAYSFSREFPRGICSSTCVKPHILLP